MAKPLTESVLYRLMAEGAVAFLGQSDKFECALYPGVASVFSTEPVADLNYVVAGRGAGDHRRFNDVCRTALERELPFVAIVFPEAGDGPAESAGQLGLTYVTDFPIMVREDAPVAPGGNDAIDVRPATGQLGAEACAGVLAAAFAMPEDAALRAMPAAVAESPSVDVFLAYDGDRPVGAVTLTHHGDTTGIWAMGTEADRQRRGVGRRLLTAAMAEARAAGGPRRFFLGATPAGFRLYESLGFETRFVTRAWAAGETHQS